MDELISIIKHELCHYHLHQEGKGYKHRDQDFKDLLKKLVVRDIVHLFRALKKREAKRILTYICIEL